MAKAANASRFYGTGRRKKSIARVYLVPGTGNITINKRSLDEYFGLETLKTIVRQPLAATDTVEKFDILVNVCGGGYTGQAGAIRHGISRALLQVDGEVRIKGSSSCSSVLKEIISLNYLININSNLKIPKRRVLGFFACY